MFDEVHTDFLYEKNRPLETATLEQKKNANDRGKFKDPNDCNGRLIRWGSVTKKNFEETAGQRRDRDRWKAKKRRWYALCLMFTRLREW